MVIEEAVIILWIGMILHDLIIDLNIELVENVQNKNNINAKPRTKYNFSKQRKWAKTYTIVQSMSKIFAPLISLQ